MCCLFYCLTRTPKETIMLYRIIDACSKALLLAAMLMALPVLAADHYPAQTIKLVVGFPPGGGGDLYGRLIAESISKTLGTSVVVENKPGAGEIGRASCRERGESGGASES